MTNLGATMKALLFLTVLATATVGHWSASADVPHLLGCKNWKTLNVGDGSLTTRLERLASKQQRFTISGSPTVKVGICASADEKDSSSDAAVTVQENGQSYVAGRLTTVALDGNKQWISLSYGKGDVMNTTGKGNTVSQERSATLIFLCDPSSSAPTLQKPNQNDLSQSNHLVLIVVSSEACEASGGSFFGTLFTLIVVAGLLYMIIGFLYNRLAKGARGFEQIPNYNFWSSIVNSIQEKIESVTGRDAYSSAGIGGGDRSAFGANRNQSDDTQLLGREDLNQGPVSQRLHPVTDSDNDDRLLPL